MVVEVLAEISGVGSFIVANATGKIIGLRGKDVELEAMFDQVGIALETGRKLGFMFKVGNEYQPLPPDAIVQIDVTMRDKTKGRFKMPVGSATET